MDIGKSGNCAGACCEADRSGRALQHSATAHATIEFPTIAHGHLPRCQAAFSGDGTVTELRVFSGLASAGSQVARTRSPTVWLAASNWLSVSWAEMSAPPSAAIATRT